MRYKWQGDDPERFTNRGLRAAQNRGLPLIWFWGVAPGMHKPSFPVYLVDEEPEKKQFVVATDGLQNIESTGEDLPEVVRRYAMEQTRKRLHQPVFRGLVMQAYKTQCAVCQLRHSPLLDAAHIVEDGHERGVAAVRNGLSLCKIHHSAYDAGILGVRPDYVIDIREDVLEEIDGPILEYGLKRLHGEKLRVLPRGRHGRPDPGLLEVHYAEFRNAEAAKTYRIDFGML